MKKIILFAAAAIAALSASAQTPKFAHVNFNELIMLTPAADSARTKLALIQKENQETFNSMYQEFQTKYQQYEQKKSTWTPTILANKEKELSDIQNRLQEFEQSASQDLQQMQTQLMTPIQQKAMEVVNELAKAGGYIYVFEQSSMLYIDAAQSKDLTPDARKKLGIPEGRTLETLQQELQAQAAQSAQ